MLPEPIFYPKLLKIGKKGEAPVYQTIVWGAKQLSDNVDVLWLIEYLESKGRDCHVNTGVHGKLSTDGIFEFDWK